MKTLLDIVLQKWWQKSIKIFINSLHDNFFFSGEGEIFSWLFNSCVDGLEVGGKKLSIFMSCYLVALFFFILFFLEEEKKFHIWYFFKIVSNFSLEVEIFDEIDKYFKVASICFSFSSLYMYFSFLSLPRFFFLSDPCHINW